MWRALLPLLLVPVLLLTQTAPAGAGVRPPNGAWVGAWVEPGSYSRTGFRSAVNGLESKIGTKLDIVQYYYGWAASFPTWREKWHARNGRIPLVSWSGYDTDAIRNGSQDSVIRRRADAVDAFGRPLFVRWLWEMDSYNSRSVSSPASFIAAWRRIVTIFRDRGATNASFVWCPTAWSFVTGAAPRYWPGRGYVDWVCSDGYNWYPGRKGSDWVSFRHIFRGMYAFGRRVHKPMMVGEYGVQHDPAAPLRRARWIAASRRTLKQDFPRIKAVLYFHADRVYDWRLRTRSSMTAFRRMAKDGYFNR